MPLFGEHVPERGWTPGRREVVEIELANPLQDFGMVAAGLGDPGQVAFDVRHEDRNSDAAELFRQQLQGHGFSGPGGTGDQAVPIGHGGQQKAVVLSTSNQNRVGETHKEPFKLGPFASQAERGGGRRARVRVDDD